MTKTGQNQVTDGNSYTVDDVLTKAGFGLFHWKLLFLTGLLWSVDAIEIMLLTFLIPILQDQWDLQSPWDSMIGVLVFFGSFVGGLLFSKISDKYGRKWVIMLCAGILSTAGVTTAFVNNIQTMLVCRFFSGLGISGMIISLTLFQEFVPHNYRGRMMVVEMMFWSAGSIFSVMLAWAILTNFPEDTGWRVYVGLASIPAWIVTVTSAWIPESIRWYCTVGMFNEAENLAHRILKDNGKEPMEGRLIRTESIALRGKVRDMFVPKYRRTSFVMILIFMLSIFCYYGIVLVSERLFVDSSLYVCEFVTTIAELPALAFGWVMDRIGRKSTILCTWILNTIGFLIIALMWFYATSDTIAMVIVVFIVRLSSFANAITIFLYFTEYYPTAIRTTALGLGYSMTRLTTGGAVFISEDIDIVTANLMFGGCSLIALVSTFLIPEDTTGKLLTNRVDRTDCQTKGADALSKGKPVENYTTINSE